MLFPYTYVPHKMEKMQEFIDFIFRDVWCMAPANGPFRLELFLGNPDLHEVMENFSITDTRGGDFFNSHVERIYALFAKLKPNEIKRLRDWFDGNNNIESVCANDPLTQIVRYKELEVLHPNLCSQLAAFFKGLYTDTLLERPVLKAKIGDMSEHHKAFVTINRKGRCPFCGLEPIFGRHHSKREAYDHFLPKAHYPFNSINFRNLVPACHHCNSSYKTSKDPAHEPKQPTHSSTGNRRRKIFYPFTTQPHKIEIQVHLRATDVLHLEKDDIDLQFGPHEKSEEIETWREIYGIDEQYKAMLCSEDAKAWFEENRIFADLPNQPVSGIEAIRTVAESYPYANANFLRLAFLEACETAGLLAPLPEPGHQRIQ